nr:MAG TPA: NPR1/NIM1 like defence protein C terminal [Caudoviricetes sp.]
MTWGYTPPAVAAATPAALRLFFPRCSSLPS